ncbi:MAG: DNA-directed RNA polymerase subunit omega [Acidobacteriota bacterium]
MGSNIGSVDSKFRYIILAAKRTRQLQAGARPQVATSPTQPRKFTRIAQEEVSSGLVEYEITEEVKPARRGAREAKSSKR